MYSKTPLYLYIDIKMKSYCHLYKTTLKDQITYNKIVHNDKYNIN